MNKFQFEVCANSVESCLAAQKGGANRVELCAGIPEGGTTPSYGEISVAREVLDTTRLHVIIRPREYKTLSMMIAYGNEKKNSKYCTLRCAIVIYLLLFFVLQFFILSSEGVYTSDVLKIY